MRFHWPSFPATWFGDPTFGCLGAGLAFGYGWQAGVLPLYVYFFPFRRHAYSGSS